MSTIKGIWVFKESIEFPSTTISNEGEVLFNSYNSPPEGYNGFLVVPEGMFSPDPNTGPEGIGYWIGSTTISVYDARRGWDYEAHRTVDFGETEQEVSDEFYTWFTANAIQLKVTDLTGTTWSVPAGWEAEAGYGVFDIETGEDELPYRGFGIGYESIDETDDVYNTSAANTVCRGYAAPGSSTAVYSSTTAFTITILRGDDVQNVLLISWLSQYGELIGAPAVTHTINGKWKFNETLVQSTFNCVWQDVKFTCNGVEYLAIVDDGGDTYNYIGYSPTTEADSSGSTEYLWAYTGDKWNDEAYRTIDFGSTEQTVKNDFYSWFIANAVQQAEEPTPAATFDLSTLNLPAGIHFIYVKLNADGYSESEASNAVEYGDRTEPVTGDTYTYGNYTYRYNYHYSPNGWEDAAALNGWGVRCNNNVEDPGEILTSVKGKPIKFLDYAFYNCTNLTKAPVIPSTLYSMEGAFYGCDSLRTPPEIPEGIRSLNYAFYSSGIETPPKIPESCTSIQRAFYQCSALSSIPVIPEATYSMEYAFYKCSRATGTIKILSNKSIFADYAFYYCDNISSIEISEGVTEIDASAFEMCYDLISITLPSTLISIRDNAFYLCRADDVYFLGTESKWNAMYIDSSSATYLNQATIHFAAYDIETALTYCTASSSNSDQIDKNGTATLMFIPQEGTSLPVSVSVTNADYQWYYSSGTLVISNPVGNVSVTITAIKTTSAYLITTELDESMGMITEYSTNPTEIEAGETATLSFSGFVNSASATGADLEYSVEETPFVGNNILTAVLSNPTSDVVLYISSSKKPDEPIL